MTCSISTPANNAVASLLAGEALELPTINLNGYTVPAFAALPAIPAPSALTLDQLTEGSIEGNGVFDKIMKAYDAHLKEQYQRNRITGDAYAKTYSALVESAMGAAVQFLLQKDQTYWSAITARQSAYLANAQLARAVIEADTARAQLAMAMAQMKNERAAFALTKAKVATEEAAYCVAQYDLTSLKPAQLDQLTAQTSHLTTREGPKVATETDNLTKQGLLIDEQKRLVKEQVEQTRAQTMDTRTDFVAVGGLMGTQKQLYAQQIDSYKRDQEHKYLKILTDAWVTQKTMDEGLVPPTSFTNASIDTVMARYRTNTSLV